MLFRKLTKAVLKLQGHKAVGYTNPEEVSSFIEFVRSNLVNVDLIRIGGDGDGGYLMPQDFEGVRNCFSPGVDVTADFEQDLLDQFEIRSFLADASVDRAPADHFDFEKKFVGSQNTGSFMTLASWMDKKQETATDTDMVLQMDIEGAEYEVLIETPSVYLNRFRMLTIEFHDMQQLLLKGFSPLIRAVFAKLCRDFAIVHMHPNNWCGVESYCDIRVPKVIEFTFLRKDRVDALKQDTPISLPHPLDRPNVASAADMVMPDIWWRTDD